MPDGLLHTTIWDVVFGKVIGKGQVLSKKILGKLSRAIWLLQSVFYQYHQWSLFRRRMWKEKKKNLFKQSRFLLNEHFEFTWRNTLQFWCHLLYSSLCAHISLGTDFFFNVVAPKNPPAAACKGPWLVYGSDASTKLGVEQDGSSHGERVS